MIVYIHGFNSSSASVKARLMHEALRSLNRGHEFLALDLHHVLSIAMRKLEQEITRHDAKQIVVIGSSLGGHYATRLAGKHDLPAVLVNPAVNPHQLLVPCLGTQKNLYTGEQYQFTQQHLRDL